MFVVTLPCGGSHRASDITHLGVVQDTFETVADLDAAPSRGHDQQHQDAAVVLVANLPLLFERGGELLDGLIAVDGFDGDDGNLGVGLPVHLGAELLQAGLGSGREDAGKVVDVTGWRR